MAPVLAAFYYSPAFFSHQGAENLQRPRPSSTAVLCVNLTVRMVRFRDHLRTHFPMIYRLNTTDPWTHGVSC
jgi:hypothetical protein